MLAVAAQPAAPNLTHALVHGLLPLWPLWTIVALVGAVRVALQVRAMRRLRRAGIFEIDAMDGPTFERRMQVLFRSLGYETHVTGSRRGDFGCDLLLTKERVRTVVQAKRWKKTVGIKAVQEAHAARSYYGATRALVVTYSRFSTAALDLAKAAKVDLWDRDRLVAELVNAGRG